MIAFQIQVSGFSVCGNRKTDKLCSCISGKGKDKMAERKNAIVSLFTRFPNPPGSCKTRLIPTLGPRGATRCQTVMTERILDTLVGLGDIAVEVRYATSSNDDDDVSAAMDFWLSPRRVNDRSYY